MPDISRRGFLIALTGSTVAATVVPRTVTDLAAQVAAPTTGHRVTPVDVGIGMESITPLDALYTARYAAGPLPALDVETWRLQIGGLVEESITLDYAQILALPALEDVRSLECVNNPTGGRMIGNLRWRGAAFADLIRMARPKSSATHVYFEAADGYTTAVRIDVVRQPDAMLAYALNEALLTPDRGFPLRLHLPGLYGYKMPRWLTRIEFLDQDYLGYWECAGWSNSGEVRTKSVILGPVDDTQIAYGESVALYGIATAGNRAITAVEIQIDGGEWFLADLGAQAGPLAWREWSCVWRPAAPGLYQIAVRATDDSGFVQSAEREDPFPKGTAAIHKIVLRVTG